MRVVSTTTPPLTVSTVAKLFGVGATIGPLVDSLHNQCLLRYDYAPIHIPFPTTNHPVVELAGLHQQDLWLATSWIVPPLLGLAYVILGGVMPRVFQSVIHQVSMSTVSKDEAVVPTHPHATKASPPNVRTRAIIAVLTTAAIIKYSAYLQGQHDASLLVESFPSSSWPMADIMNLLFWALLQWAILDGTLAALLVAGVTSIGGPLSELPFVAGGFWEYLPSAGDYLPLQGWGGNELLSHWLGPDYESLALSSLTGPCYFAVTMDAIALGRWFDVGASSPPDKET